MQIQYPDCVPRNYLQLIDFLWNEDKIPKTASEDNLPDFGLVCAAGILGDHISYLFDPIWAFHMSKSKVSSRPKILVVKLLPVEAIEVSKSAPKHHVVLGCENISRAELISLVNIQVPGVLRVDATVLGLFGVLFTSCLDL
jgi:hypothetical protein